MTNEKFPTVRQMILQAEPKFYENLDPNLKLFCREIRRELREEGHVVIAITGYPGLGKSNDTAIIGSIIDPDYTFEKNICFIPTSSEIENSYMGLNMYSFLHIDEASRGLHKHKWHDKVQQKLNQLYDTEREGHFLCTALLMPRFQNFTENFRNFMIKYWIHIPAKGLAMFYKRDDDKDCKDPWHIDENYKMKLKKFKGKRVFERTLPEQVRAEQHTDCYWFYAQIPAVPKVVWERYQELKKESRVKAREVDVEIEPYKDRMNREKIERWNKIRLLKAQGKTNEEVAVLVGMAVRSISRTLREIEAYDRIKGLKGSHNSEVSLKGSPNPDVLQIENNIIYNQLNSNKKNENLC